MADAHDALPRDYLVFLRRAMVEHCTEQELEILCFDLNADFGSVATGDSKLLKTQRLIEYFNNRGRLHEVVNWLKSEFKNVNWDAGLAAQVQPAQREATAAEIAAPDRQTLASPDRQYLIDKPPPGWSIQELTYSEWINQVWVGSAPAASAATGAAPATSLDSAPGRPTPAPSQASSRASRASKPGGAALDEPAPREILRFEKAAFRVDPIPGETRINGRLVPTALGLDITLSLTVVPMDRAQPPLFIERSLEHNFMITAGTLAQVGTMTLVGSSSSSVGAANRPRLTAEFAQEVENAIVNSQPGQNLIIRTALIGLGGEMRDYVLIIQSAEVPTAQNAALQQDRKMLEALVNSFRPLALSSPEQRRKEQLALAERRYGEFIALAGEGMFAAEFRIFLLRVKNWDLDDPELRLDLIRQLQLFEKFARMVKLDNEELNTLWDAVHAAAAGKASALKAELSKWIGLLVQADAEEPNGESSPQAHAALPDAPRKRPTARPPRAASGRKTKAPSEMRDKR